MKIIKLNELCVVVGDIRRKLIVACGKGFPVFRG